MRFSSEALRHLVYGQLTPAQQLEASGTFSGNQLPHNWDAASNTNPINIWFEKDTTTMTKKLILAQNNIVAILVYYNNVFQVVSLPKPLMDTSTREEFIVGHLGDNINHIVPSAFTPDTILANFIGFLPSDSEEDASLSHLKSTGPDANEQFPVADETPITFLSNANNVTLPNDFTFEDVRTASLPLSIPLPHGHGIKSTPINDKAGIQTMSTRLYQLSPSLGRWFESIELSIDVFRGKSLHSNDFNIDERYFEGIQLDAARESIAADCKTIAIESPMASYLLVAKDYNFNWNFDKWCTENKDVYEELTSSINQSGPQPAPHADPPQYPMSKADKNSEARFTRVSTFYKILLATTGVDAEGNDIIIPGNLNPAVISFLEESTHKSLLSHLQLNFCTYIETRTRTMTVMGIDTELSPLAFGSRLATAVHAGEWSMHPVQNPMSQLNRFVSLFAMLRQYKTEEYTASIEKEMDIRDEHTMGVTSNNATKADTKLASDGAQNSYRDLCAGIANMHMFLSFLSNISADDKETESESFLLGALTKLFKTVRSKECEDWFAWARKNDYYWLCHCFLTDVHNVICEGVKIAANQKNIADVLQDNDLNKSLLVNFDQVLTRTLSKWATGFSTLSLGMFTSPPSTLPESIKSKKEKEQAKKRQKTDTPGPNPPNNRQGSNNGNGSPSGLGNFTRHGSNPSKGFIKVNPQDSNIPFGPQVRGLTPCGNFIIVGRSCPEGARCPFGHVTGFTFKSEDIPAYENWFRTYPALSWVNGQPPTGGNPQQNQRNQRNQQSQQQNQQQNQQQSRGNNSRNNSGNQGNRG